MQIKSIIIDNIQYTNFIPFNSTFFCSCFLFLWFAQLKFGCVLHAVKY